MDRDGRCCMEPDTRAEHEIFRPNHEQRRSSMFQYYLVLFSGIIAYSTQVIL